MLEAFMAKDRVFKHVAKRSSRQASRVIQDRAMPLSLELDMRKLRLRRAGAISRDALLQMSDNELIYDRVDLVTTGLSYRMAP